MPFKGLIFTIHFALLTVMLCCAVYKIRIDKREWDRRRSLKKQGRQWRATSQSRRASGKMSLYIALLWAGICMCFIMEGNDLRVFWFFFGLFFLALAAAQFD